MFFSVAYTIWQAGLDLKSEITGWVILVIFGPWLLWAVYALIKKAIEALAHAVRTLARRGLLAIWRAAAPTVKNAGRHLVRLLVHLSRPWITWSSRNLVYRMLSVLEPEFVRPTIQEFRPEKVRDCTCQELDLQEAIVERYRRLVLWMLIPLMLIGLTIPIAASRPITRLLMLVPLPFGNALTRTLDLLAGWYGALIAFAILWPFGQRARAWREQISQLARRKEAQKEVTQISKILGDRIQVLYAGYLHAVERTRLAQQEAARVERTFELLRTLPEEQQDDAVFTFKTLMDSYRDEVAKSSSESERRERIWEVFLNLFFGGFFK